MASKPDSTGGTTSETGKAVQAKAEVGGVCSSVDPMPVPPRRAGERIGERRDATCPAAGRRNEELVTALSRAISTENRSGIAKSMPTPRLWPWRKGLGKPDAVNPPVRFDEGRETDVPSVCFPPTLHPFLRSGRRDRSYF